MNIAEGTQSYFNKLLKKQFNYKANKLNSLIVEYTESGTYPLQSDEAIKSLREDNKPMCFVTEYVSTDSLQVTRDKYIISKIETREYIRNLHRWTMQILTSYHFTHQGNYINNTYKGSNFLIDASNNVVVNDLGLSEHVDQPGAVEVMSKLESTKVFSLLLAHCGRKGQVLFYDDKFRIKNNLTNINEQLSQFAINLCEKYWKKWNLIEEAVGLLRPWLRRPFLDDAFSYESAEDILQKVFGTTPIEVTCEYLPDHPLCIQAREQ
eukprot:GHVR01108850.1.p1 GENE.GHVR01108850.1~~GHVR01108850.1.p1  ORF type:complete len:265 (+),score=19.90 GHVR01108850.1:214-1008(+)